jgi:hypothetical protein
MSIIHCLALIRPCLAGGQYVTKAKLESEELLDISILPMRALPPFPSS